jgi:hypothetical protein
MKTPYESQPSRPIGEGEGLETGLRRSADKRDGRFGNQNALAQWGLALVRGLALDRAVARDRYGRFFVIIKKLVVHVKLTSSHDSFLRSF